MSVCVACVWRVCALCGGASCPWCLNGRTSVLACRRCVFFSFRGASRGLGGRRERGVLSLCPCFIYRERGAESWFFIHRFCIWPRAAASEVLGGMAGRLCWGCGVRVCLFLAAHGPPDRASRSSVPQSHKQKLKKNQKQLSIGDCPCLYYIIPSSRRVCASEYYVSDEALAAASHVQFEHTPHAQALQSGPEHPNQGCKGPLLPWAPPPPPPGAAAAAKRAQRSKF